MLQSGNDCAVAIAYELAGGVENFADMMNNRAKELGANNTNFVTPNGLHDDNHYTTAYDLGLIACQALSNQAFREIVGTKSVKISNEGFDYQRVITNKNKLLGRLDGADGVKTGYTKKAGRCFVGSATRNGMSLVCVVLNCAPMFEESAELIEYGFENYALKRILPKNKMLGLKTDGKSNLVYTCAEGFSYPLRKDGSEDNKISVLTDTENGKLEIKFDNELIFSSTIGIININD
jgi:D-alanyl-D-alanine carboxypeptidase (penicillin-binding protein 5/6)